jgi:hypothetical protein
MFGNDNFALVIEAVDVLRAELREIDRARLHFRIVHRFRPPGADCVPGEEVLAILLVHRGREYQLGLSPAMLVVADYLLRHSRYAQTASQIATGIHEGRFYSEYGHSVRRQRVWRIPRSAVKEYIKRLRRALAMALGDAHVRIDPRDVLEAEQSVSNHVLYRWKGVVELVHLDFRPTECRSPLGSEVC